MRKIYLFIAVVILVFSGCNRAVSDDLKIVTTIAPLYSLTANLIEGVDNVELSNLVPPGSSVHTFSLTPKLAQQTARADLIIINGLGLEEFLDDTFEISEAQVVDTSEGVNFLEASLEEQEEHHSFYDPHIWLSPVNAKVQAANIEKALEEADPINAELYRANLVDLESRLDELHQEVKAGFSELDIKPYLVFHDAYSYFERDFGVHAVAFIEEFPGKEPSAKYLAEIIDLIESDKVEVIFAEAQFSPKLIESLSSEYGLKVGALNPLGKSISKDEYFDLIRGNLLSFQEVFKSKK